MQRASSDAYEGHVGIGEAMEGGPPPVPTRRGSVELAAAGQPKRSQAKNPFYKAANNPPGTTTQLYFQAKYYGPCPEISADDESPVLTNVLDIMSAKKAAGLVVKCNLYFSEQGVAVGDRKTNETVASWPTRYLASCATIKHPTSRTRRIGLFKVRDPGTHTITWHLFKYYFTKVDNMSDCFRFIVDCSLRDIGRAYASQLATQRGTAVETIETPPAHRQAWAEPVPPSYHASQSETASTSSASTPTSCGETPARRRLLFSSDEVAAEAADLAASANRVPQYSQHPSSIQGGYMDVASTA